MNTPAPRTSLQFRFALSVVVAASLLCIVAGGLAYRIGRERAVATSRSALDGLAEAVAGTVAEGAYTKDPVLLGEVARGLARNELVAAIEVRSENGALLMRQAGRGHPASHADLIVERRLASPFNAHETVGTLLIAANETQIAAIAAQSALQLAVLMGGLVVLIAVLLYWVAERFVSRPVVELARQLRAVQPGTAHRLALPRYHQHDEIGILIQGTNALLEATTDALTRERTVRAGKEQAEAASLAKSQFLATMSHEIRTPLNGVLGMNELLIGSDLQPQQREWAAAVQSSGQHLLSVINDILDFSKIESGQMDLEVVDFNVLELIEQALAMFAQPAASKGLELATRFLPEDLTLVNVRGDPFRLRQVLANLVANAIKFTDRGEVIVRVALAADPDGATRVEICVADTGIGIAPAAQSGIFESFSQADGSTTRRYGGTGLGLAICRRLVTLMGGSLRVESVVGRGSEFHVQLRLPKGRAVTPEQTDTTVLRGARVMVVDDNQTNRDILCQQLGGYGMNVTSVCGSKDALGVLRRSVGAGISYDLLVLDMHMPEMDGLPLAVAIRALRSLPFIPILMLTSAVTCLSPQQRESGGIGRCLTKPVRHSELVTAIASLLSGRPPADRSAPVPPQRPAATRGVILVVEDNPTNQRVAVGMLSAMGLRCAVAENGRAAVAAVRERAFDLVLMDCQMPIMDGYEATAAIRALPNGRGKLPIVALTANAMQHDQQQCLAAGMDDFLAKPFSVAQLEATVSRWLPSSTAAQAAPAREPRAVGQRA